MGSVASRAKRVAPALVREDDALERTDLDVGRLFNTPTAPRRFQHDCGGEGQESHVLPAKEKLEDEVERILDACENTDGGNRGLFQKAFFTSKSCGFCYGRRGETGSDTNGNHRLVHSKGQRKGPQSFEDKNVICQKPETARRADPLCTKAASVPELCNHPPLALPVFYDTSEEDLMNTIEGEFD